MIQIKLKKSEVEFLEEFVKRGVQKARAIARANVLLLAHEGYDAESISKITRVHRQSVWRVKKRYLSEGLQSALDEKQRPGQPRKYTGKHEAEIIATACTSPPEGREKWTVRLLAEALRNREGFGTINRESVRLILKKAGLSLG